MDQRKIETRGRPGWTTAPSPLWRVSDSGRALSIGFDRHRPALGFNSPLRIFINVDLPQPCAPIKLIAIPPPNFTDASEKRGLAPNCMAMPEATITRVPQTKKLPAASSSTSNYDDTLY